MNNCPAHPDIEEMISGKMKTIFLPSNITTLLQPMQKGALENLKRNYKRKLLKTLIRAIDERNSNAEKIIIKYVVCMLAEARNEVTN